MIRAYNEEYLSYARNLMGKMFDFAVYDLGYKLDDFYNMFIESGLAERFYKGETKIITGLSGYELALQVINIIKGDVGILFPHHL